MAWCFHSKNDTLGIFACACFQTKSTLISVITCLIWNVESDCEANKTGQQIKLPGIFNKMWFGRGAALFRFPGHSLVLYTLKQSENENIWGAFEANSFERFYTFEHMVTRLALRNINECVKVFKMYCLKALKCIHLNFWNACNIVSTIVNLFQYSTVLIWYRTANVLGIRGSDAPMNRYTHECTFQGSHQAILISIPTFVKFKNVI